MPGRGKMYKGTEVRTCLVYPRMRSWALEGNMEKGWGQQEPKRELGPEGTAR